MHMRCMRHEHGDKSLFKFDATNNVTFARDWAICNATDRFDDRCCICSFCALAVFTSAPCRIAVAGVVRSTYDCHGRVYDIVQKTEPCLASALATVHDVAALVSAMRFPSNCRVAVP